MAQELQSKLQLNIKATSLHYPDTPSIQLQMSKMAKSTFTNSFCQSCQIVKVHYLAYGRLWNPVNGINKDACGAKLVPMTVSAHPVDCVFLCHLKHSTAVGVLMEGITCIQFSTILHHLSHPLSPTHSIYVPLMILQQL